MSAPAAEYWVMFGYCASDVGFRILTADEVADLLAKPKEWGVSEFGTLAEMQRRERPNPEYWPDGYAVLARVRDVVPVLSSFTLPKGETL